MNCPVCGSPLEPQTITFVGWKCPANPAHVDLVEDPGICEVCDREGKTTGLVRVTRETQTYRCPLCEKTLPDLLAAKPDEYWLKVEFEALKPGLAGAFISQPAQMLASDII